MPKMTIDQLEAGMVVARAVADRQGRTIIKEGTTLSALHLRKLPQWGINEIYVNEVAETVRAPQAPSDSTPPTEAAEQDSTEADDEQLRAEITERVDARFAGTKDSELMKVFKVLSIKHLVNRYRSA